MTYDRALGNSQKESQNANTQCGGCCTRITNLSVKAGAEPIIENINLHLHCGEFSVITGPNGAGKSTLIKAIAGERAFTGEILFHRFESHEKMKPKIGYVPQKHSFDPNAPLTVEDIFALCLSKRPRWLFNSRAIRKLALESLETVGAAHLLSRKIGCLSGGELQRVFLSLALNPRPDILLLDEPVSGLDAAGLNIFYAMISELRTKYDLSVVMISHDFHLSARYADKLIFLNKTVICEGTPAQMIRDERVNRFFHITDEKLSNRNTAARHHITKKADANTLRENDKNINSGGHG